MLRVHGKVHLLNDPEQQKKMLANRRISGEYMWSDGTKFTYTGTYEKKLLEFLDDVMGYDSKDIITPGPTFEYEYKGKKHYWITDALIVSMNLCIDVKDGEDNPNNRFMPEYRAKQVEKEKMITNQGTYSYLRLTNNNFAQLLSILAEMKLKIVENDTSPTHRIHEDTESEIYFLESIGINMIEKMKQTYLPIKINYTGRFNDTDVPVYEMFEIKPLQRNASGNILFRQSISEVVDMINDNYPGVEVECNNINRFDIMEGVTVNILTSDI
jgi:hypothetical protein